MARLHAAVREAAALRAVARGGSIDRRLGAGGRAAEGDPGEGQMPRSAKVQLRTYRHHRLEVRDDRGEGWCVVIHGPGDAAPPEVLRNRVPNGLGTLMGEARRRVDQRLDGCAPAPDFP